MKAIKDKKIENTLYIHGIHDLKTLSEMTGINYNTLRQSYVRGTLPGYQIAGVTLVRIDEVRKRWGMTPVDLRKIKRSN